MKRYLFYSISTLLLIGCSLDEEPKDQIPEDEAYTTVESLYQNTVATLYNYIGGNTDGQGLQGTCRGVYDLQTFGSDEAMLPTRGIDWYDGGLWQAMYKHSWNPGHELLGNSWKYLYKVITLCNNSLEKLEEHKELAGEYLIQWQAEVRALRAIFYWYLIDLFGDVPLVVSTTVSMNDVQSSERAAVFDFIVGELESTLSDLPPVNSVEHGIFYGHITQPVSLFVLAKLMLNAPVYTGRTSNKYYISCIEYCDEIENCGFQLEGFYDNNFESNNELSRENIFVIPMDKNLYSNQQQNIYRSLHYRHAAGLGFTGENGTCATRRALEIFGYFDEEPDIRFYHNFYSDYLVDTDGDFITDRTGKVLKYVPEAVELDLSNSPYIETAGARMRKYVVDVNNTKDGKLMDNDIVLFRFADVLLMRAEAKERLGESGQAELDLVRKRATVSLKPCTLENLLDERMLELCWEGWRRQDLIRFGKYRSLYTGPDAIDESDGHTTVFPIPGDVVTLNNKIHQNKGY